MGKLGIAIMKISSIIFVILLFLGLSYQVNGERGGSIDKILKYVKEIKALLKSESQTLASYPNFETTRACDQVFADNNFNYDNQVGHGIHSLSLEEIRYFFKNDAPEDNGIPTMNMDFSSDRFLNPNAELMGFTENFASWSLKILDWYSLNTDVMHKNMTVMEKLTHHYHMQEIYQKTSPIFKQMLADPPKDPFLCTCATDIEATGIRQYILNTVECFRLNNYTLLVFDYDTYKSIKLTQHPKDEVEEARHEYKINPSHQLAAKLHKLQPWIPGTFNGPDNSDWIPYSAMLKTSEGHGEDFFKNLALYLYCKLV